MCNLADGTGQTRVQSSAPLPLKPLPCAMGRGSSLEDVVGAALFLASPASAYVNGAVITVDGGLTADASLGWRPAGQAWGPIV